MSQRTRANQQTAPQLRVSAIGRKLTASDDLYHFLLTISWVRFFAASAVVYLLVNFLFACAYTLQPGSVSGSTSFRDTFFFSVQTMSTIGYGTMGPASLYAHILVTAQAITGIFAVALVTGITFAKFARPTARVLFAAHPVIGNRDGVPHLMFRMANWRHNQILDAELKVLLLLSERTREGETMRIPTPLRLVRPSTTLFFLTWIPMHRIDETSPLFGRGTLERLHADGAQLVLSLSGTDETLASTIHARQVYELKDIVVGARYSDVLTVLADGSREIDYSKFDDTVPVEADLGPESPPG